MMRYLAAFLALWCVSSSWAATYATFSGTGTWTYPTTNPDFPDRSTTCQGTLEVTVSGRHVRLDILTQGALQANGWSVQNASTMQAPGNSGGFDANGDGKWKRELDMPGYPCVLYVYLNVSFKWGNSVYLPTTWVRVASQTVAINWDGEKFEGPVLPPVPRDFKDHVQNDGPFPEWYQFFGRDAQGNLTPIGSPIKVPPYSGMDLSFHSDDMAGDIVLGKLNDVAEGQQGQSVNWISLQNQQGQTGNTPTPNPASPVPSGGTPQTANGTPATGTSTGGRGNPLTFGQTGGAATAVDKGVAETVYGVGTVANGLLEAIRQNTEATAKALTDAPPGAQAPALAEPEDKLKLDSAQVTALPSKILPKAPEVKQPVEVGTYNFTIPIPKAGTYSLSIDAARYSTGIVIFKTLVRSVLAFWFFFLAVRTVKGAFADA